MVCTFVFMVSNVRIAFQNLLDVICLTYCATDSLCHLFLLFTHFLTSGWFNSGLLLCAFVAHCFDLVDWVPGGVSVNVAVPTAYLSGG